MATILIAEDDKHIQLLIKARLKPYYTVLTADNGMEALKILESSHVDLLIADIMMPILNGFELVNEVRNAGLLIPVLMLTARQAFEDKKTGFRSGIDDYMTKPVHYEELLLRIEALLRRYNIAANKKIVINKTTLDSTTYTLQTDKQTIQFPKKEFDLLYKLLSYPGQIFTRNQLLDDIWGYDSESSEDTIKTHISRIRNRCKDIKDFELVTIKGLGYKADIKNMMLN